MLHAKMLGGLTRSLLKNKIGHGQARGNALIATRSRTARNLTWEYGSYSKKSTPKQLIVLFSGSALQAGHVCYIPQVRTRCLSLLFPGECSLSIQKIVCTTLKGTRSRSERFLELFIAPARVACRNLPCFER